LGHGSKKQEKKDRKVAHIPRHKIDKYRSMPSAFAELYLEQQTALRENVDFFEYLPGEKGFGMVKKSLSERDVCTMAVQRMVKPL